MPEKRAEYIDREPADLLFEELDSLFQRVAAIYEGNEDLADYSALLSDERFRNAPAVVQERLCQKYDLSIPEPASEEPKTAAPVDSAEQPATAESEATAENDSNGQPLEFPVDWDMEAAARNPHPRIFTGYRWQEGKDGRPQLVEKGRVFNKKTKQYEEYRHPPVADIRFPEGLLPRLNEPELRLAVADFCSRLRKHLGEGGLNLYFDDVKDENNDIERWRPKWKYTLKEAAPGEPKEPVNEYLEIGPTWEASGQKVEDPRVIPADIIGLVEDHLRQAATDKSIPEKGYRRDAVYRQWYGKAIQAEREAIISERLAEQEFEKMPTSQTATEAPVIAEAGSTPSGEPKSDSESAKPTDRQRKRLAGFAKAGREASKKTRSKEAAPASRPNEPVKESAPQEAPELAPEVQVGRERLLADAGPVIGPLLEAYGQIYENDPKSQIREVVKACMTKLNDKYQKEGLIPKDDRQSLVAFTDDLVETVRQRIADRQFQAENPELSAGEFTPVGEGAVEMRLQEKAWRQSVMDRARELVAQAAAEMDSRLTDERQQRVAAALSEVLTRYRQTKYSQIDLDQGKLTLKNWDDFKKMLKRGLKPKDR